MNAQVFTTSTSASSADEVISIPLCKTLPSMISASTKFLAQPRLIMPTFVLMFGAKMKSPALLDRDVFVTTSDRLTVLLDLNRVAIQNPDRDFLAMKLYRAVRWRDPSFK